jgi:hypothetical protein
MKRLGAVRADVAMRFSEKRKKTPTIEILSILKTGRVCPEILFRLF